MNPVEIIRKKREGEELAPAEIESFLHKAEDYQLAAFLMAVYFRGMSSEETRALTEAYIRSGQTLRWDVEPTVDKHSTGGVGDKVSLIVAPLVAAAGAFVPMISGRALGHTGGTLDKLEAIPGLRTGLSIDEFKKVVKEVGCAIVAQSPELVPLDGKTYALRDATATVESVPLITASIASKKLAEGAGALVLDAKVGKGAFMKTLGEAEELARSIKEVFESYERQFKALLTAMDEPLGRAAGNGVEVWEALEVLEGKGPEDTRELSLRIAEEMLRLAGLDPSLARARLEDGSGLEKFREMIKAQGGKLEELPLPGQGVAWAEVKAPRAGYLTLNAYWVGWGLTLMGAGRTKAGQPVDPKAGVIIQAKGGQPVAEGDVAIVAYASDEAKLREALPYLERALEIHDEPPRLKPLIIAEL